MLGTSLVVQWLRFHDSNTGNAGSIPGRGTKIPHAAWRGQKNKANKQTALLYVFTSEFLSGTYLKEFVIGSYKMFTKAPF